MEVNNNENVSKILPRIFANKDENVKITVIGYHSKDNGELVAVIPTQLQIEENIDNLLMKEVYQFEFSRMTYDRLNNYKNRSMVYNVQDKTNTINQLKLRQFFLVFHLKNWNLKDQNGAKVELKFDTNNALSDQSLEMVYLLPPNLLDMILSSYEKKMNIF